MKHLFSCLLLLFSFLSVYAQLGFCNGNSGAPIFVEDFGAGEIIITAVNNEGLKKGFDIPLTKRIVERVSVPVIAHGGAGNIKHIYDVIRYANVSGVGIASMLHYEAIKFLPKIK